MRHFTVLAGSIGPKRAAIRYTGSIPRRRRTRDRAAREKRLQKAEYDLTELMGKLNTRALKTKDQIQQRVQKILQAHGVEAFYHSEIGEVKQQWTKQIGKGRPGKNTQYETIVETLYTVVLEEK